MEKHILLVDDDRDMLMLLERWLQKSYKVETAVSGREAIADIEKSIPDLVLLDYAMPEMDGPDTLKEIRKNTDFKELPVAFLTGMEDVEKEAGLEQLNPIGFLSKSMGKKKLLPAIEELFAKML